MSRAFDLFSRTAGQVLRSDVVEVGPQTPCAQVVLRMREAAARCVYVVAEGERRLLGLLTTKDVVERVAFLLPPDAPVSQAMTRPAHSVGPEEPLYRALGRMERLGISQLAVVGEGGTLLGEVRRENLLPTLMVLDRPHLKAMAGSDGVEDLRAIKQAQLPLAAALLEEGVNAPAIQSLLCAMNDSLYRLAAARAETDMENDGWGKPLVPYAVIVMGSGGRGESYLYPDQDNGFILEDYPDADHTPIDRWFWELGRRLTTMLNTIGFPFCNGNVMATNPLWRKTVSQWGGQIDGWVRRRGEVSLLYADIFLDFRAIHGDSGLGERLRRLTLDKVSTSRAFLREMSMNETHHDVGLGWFGQLVTDPEEGAHLGEINVKRNGTLPIVEAVRTAALARHCPDCSTLARLDHLHAAGAMSQDQRDSLRAAYTFMTGLLLRQQVRDAQAGRQVGNYIAPENLAAWERDTLKRAMRVSQDYSRQVKADFTGAILQ